MLGPGQRGKEISASLEFRGPAQYLAQTARQVQYSKLHNED